MNSLRYNDEGNYRGEKGKTPVGRARLFLNTAEGKPPPRVELEGKMDGS